MREAEYMAEQNRENSREDIWDQLACKYSPVMANVFTCDDPRLETIWKNLKGSEITEELILEEFEAINAQISR